MIIHYLKVAVRQLLKFRTQNLISIAGLSVCLLCFSVCMYIARFVFDTDRCFPLKERIAEVSMKSPEGERVYAAITLDTERRRKEVAIRKVNGAGVRQILWLFVRIYIWIGGVTALLAFPLLYAVLRWWEQMYAVFFSYGFRFWAGILLSVALVTAVTIVFRLLKIARVNPAEAVKTE